MIFPVPGIREKVSFSNKDSGTDKNTAGGLAAIIAGIFLLTTQFGRDYPTPTKV
jgi:hypothetical protein